MADGFFVKKITGSGKTQDGEQIFLKGADGSGKPVIIAVPREELFGLIDVCALEYGTDGPTKQLRERHKRNLHELKEYPTKLFNVRPTSDGGALLAITFGAGGTLVFSLPPQVPLAIAAALCAGYEQEDVPESVH